MSRPIFNVGAIVVERCTVAGEPWVVLRCLHASDESPVTMQMPERAWKELLHDEFSRDAFTAPPPEPAAKGDGAKCGTCGDEGFVDVGGLGSGMRPCPSCAAPAAGEEPYHKASVDTLGCLALTHNMKRRRDGVWECVDCKREGTIAEINDVACPTPTAAGSNLIDAIEGTGKYTR